MSVSKSVFASGSEKANYYKLMREWGNKYRIYHNLPFLNVLNPKNQRDISDFKFETESYFTDDEFNMLKKTSIDYTICNLQDKPLFCIEFDGMQQGFNIGVSYVPGDRIKHPNAWRKQITELKLRIAISNAFPFIVVGTTYFKDISNSTKLTIVDAIIGEMLTIIDVQEKIRNFRVQQLGMTEEEFQSLSDEEREYIIQDWVSYIEIESQFKNNPITVRRAELEKVCEGSWSSFTTFLLSYPPFKPGDIKGFESAIMHGHRIIYETRDLGPISGDAWIPNFNMPFVSGYTVTEDIAAICALEKMIELRTNKKV